MKTKVFYVIALMGFGVVSCSGSNNEGQANGEAEQVEEVQYDPVLGVGDFMDFKVEEGLNSELALKGKEFDKKFNPDINLIEKKATGITLIQDLRDALPGRVRAYNPGKADKIQRLSIVANIIAHKRVWIPESSSRKGYVRDWAEGFVSQICSFPESTHDDYVDSCTQALRYLRDAGWLDIDPAPQYDDDDYVDIQKKRENPYAV